MVDNIKNWVADNVPKLIAWTVPLLIGAIVWASYQADRISRHDEKIAGMQEDIKDNRNTLREISKDINCIRLSIEKIANRKP